METEKPDGFPGLPEEFVRQNAKANIMKKTDGKFTAICHEVAADSQHNAKPSKQKTPKKDSRKRKKSKQKKVQEPPLPEIEGEPAEDGYDGYYDDILPPDLDREKEGPDKELIKKIVSLTVAVIFIIGLCVVMMYVL